MIRDKNIEYKYQSLFLPAAAFATPSGGGGTLETVNLQEVGSTGILAGDFDAAAERLLWSSTMPSHVDWDNDIFLRVVYANQGTTSETVTWKIRLTHHAFGAAPATDDPTDSDTFTKELTLSDATNTTKHAIVATAWSELAASVITSTKDFLSLVVELDAAAAGTYNMIGIELKHLPKLTPSPQTNNQADPTDA